MNKKNVRMEFYAGVDNFKVDAKSNLGILLKLASSGLLNRLDDLQMLKMGEVVRVTLESATMHYTEKVDAETLEPIRSYKQENGVWRAIENEPLALDVGEDQVIERQEEVAADIVDLFLLTATYENNSDFNARIVLARMAEGYDPEDIAKEVGLDSAVELMKKLNEARIEYAGMAKAWDEAKEDDDEE